MVDHSTTYAEAPRGALHDAYPVRTVAQMTGLSADLIRVWEKRYHVVQPVRGPRGARLYTTGDVVRLQGLARAVAAGRSIGDVAHLDATTLQSLAVPEPAVMAATHANATGEEPIVAALLDSVRRSAIAAIEQQLADALVALGSHNFITAVATPLLYQVGDGWERGEISVAQEHLVSACLRNLLAGLLRTRRGADDPTLLLATAPGERHEFGLLLIALAARDVGVGVRYLGVDLPPQEIVATARQAGSRIVGLSAVTDAHRDSAVATLRTLDQSLPPTTSLWIGGRDAAHVSTQAGVARVRILTDLHTVQHELLRLRAATVVPRERPIRA